jgi:hypothetical protein
MPKGTENSTPKKKTRREMQLWRLASISAHVGHDELAVLLLVAERLSLGRRRYGELHIDTDPRDFRREALEAAALLNPATAFRLGAARLTTPRTARAGESSRGTGQVTRRSRRILQTSAQAPSRRGTAGTQGANNGRQ